MPGAGRLGVDGDVDDPESYRPLFAPLLPRFKVQVLELAK